MLISSVSLFMSCSDDDDVKYPVDSELAGAYKGTMDVYYVGVSTPIVSDMVQKVYISKASDTAVKLELRNFTITVAGAELLIGDITVDNCALAKSGDAYKFSGNQTLSLVVGSCNTSVLGTVGKNAVDMVIDVDVEGGMKVKVNYKGTKLSGSENTEAKITDFTIDDEVITVAPVIDDAKSAITFKVNDEATEEDLKALVPVIAVSEKATVTPASGVAQDFSGGKSVVYTVVAEDGTSRKYTASIEGVQNIIKFGIAYDKEPKLLKGVYKYKAGTNYIDGSVKPAQEGLNIIDECSIAAVLYEAKDAAGKDVTLTGVDINTSEYRVAEARLKDGTDKDEWTTFELAFEYLPEKSYDSTKEYKLAIICSSSKEGDKFKGAANSTLIVDELEVIGE